MCTEGGGAPVTVCFLTPPPPHKIYKKLNFLFNNEPRSGRVLFLFYPPPWQKNVHMYEYSICEEEATKTGHFQIKTSFII